jgi:hypothetical protein
LLELARRASTPALAPTGQTDLRSARAQVAERSSVSATRLDRAFGLPEAT